MCFGRLLCIYKPLDLYGNLKAGMEILHQRPVFDSLCSNLGKGVWPRKGQSSGTYLGRDKPHQARKNVRISATILSDIAAEVL